MPVINALTSLMHERIIAAFGVLSNLTALISPVRILSEDSQYKWHFIRDYMPQLRSRHIDESYANCIFCSNLVKSHCHKHCYKCGAGTYIRCSPPLPGAIYNEPVLAEDEEVLSLPWYYRKTCDHFKRLPKNEYHKNIFTILSSIGIYNFEILEGLENGLSAGVKPCHICASVDYELYKSCSKQGDFDTSTPCHRITHKLKEVYENQAAGQ